MISLPLYTMNSIAAQATAFAEYTAVVGEKGSQELAPGILLSHHINGKFTLVSLDPLLQSYNISGEISKHYPLECTLTSLDGYAIFCSLTKKANTLVAHIDYLI